MRYCGIIILFLIACNTVHNQGSNQEIENATSVSLISWSNKYVMNHEEDDFLYYDDHENFISKYFEVNFYEERIVATTLIEVNCIDSIVGRIEVSHDTIFLKSHVIMTDDRVCSEYHKFNFTIRNPKNIPYKIISSK